MAEVQVIITVCESGLQYVMGRQVIKCVAIRIKVVGKGGIKGIWFCLSMPSGEGMEGITG